MAAKIKKGDKIVVLTGKDKGKKGQVLSVFPQEGRALVQGVNLVKHHEAPTQRAAGGIVTREAKIQLSNLAIEDPKTGKPTRVGFKTLEDGRKVRVSKSSGEVIDG
ncbi:MAG: 50S ribosomal protein L24 [Parvibaculaceae bacterium]|nr:50S ribosomal protein L24 [Parvibaculaceae bacterium]